MLRYSAADTYLYKSGAPFPDAPLFAAPPSFRLLRRPTSTPLFSLYLFYIYITKNL